MPRLTSASSLQVHSRRHGWKLYPGGGLKGGLGGGDGGSQEKGANSSQPKPQLSCPEEIEIQNINDVGEAPNKHQETKGPQDKAGGVVEEEVTGLETSAAGNKAESENSALEVSSENHKQKNGTKEERPRRVKKRKIYDPQSDEDDNDGISVGDDTLGDATWGEEKKSHVPSKEGGRRMKSASTLTPASVFKQRRDDDVLEEWRGVGGHTPKEGKPKYGTFNMKVFDLLVHHHAKVQKIDLSKTKLQEAFFKDFVKTHGSVSGGSRLAPYTSHSYLMKMWRQHFCNVEFAPGGRKIFGTHHCQPPQEENIACRRCTGPSENDEMNNFILQKLSEKCETAEKCKTAENADDVPGSGEDQSQSGSNISSNLQAADQKIPELRDDQCPHCFKIVGNVKRHIKETCRLASNNKVECHSCKMMVGKYRLKEHLHGRTAKKTGQKTILGCLEKKKRQDDAVANKVICKVCGLSIVHITRHMNEMHNKRGVATSKKLEDGCDNKKEEKELDKKTEKEKRKRITYTRAEWNDACETAAYNIQVQVSLQQAQGDLTQAAMIRNALQYLEACGIHLLQPNILIPLDGNCLFCSLAHSQDTTLTGLSLDDAATKLRQAAVGLTLDSLDGLDDQDLIHLQNAAATSKDDRYLTRDELALTLFNYMRRGVYQGGLGDMLPQMCSSYLRRPILVVAFNTETKTTNAYFINPADVLNAEAESFVPYVLVRQGEHFVPLLVPEETGEILAADFLFSIQQRPTVPQETCKQPSTSKRDRSRSPDGDEELKRMRLNLPTTSNDLQSGIGERGSIDGESRDEGEGTNSGKRLPAPNPAFGERKKLLNDLDRMPLQFAERIKDLLKKLDNILIESPQIEEQLRRLEVEVGKILDVMKAYDKKETGSKWKTKLEDEVGGPKDPSTGESYEQCVAGKIIPFLRGYFLDRNPRFKITNIIEFGKPQFVRISEDIVEECNSTVGDTVATKRQVLSVWISLCKSLAYIVKRSIDTVGIDTVKEIKEWYSDLAGELTAGLNRLNKVYSKVRTEKASKQKSKGMPLDRVIKKWLKSDDRGNLLKDLLALAQKVRSGNTDASVSGAEFRRFREFVLTELCIYFPVRIGAWFHFTVRYCHLRRNLWSLQK